MSPHALTNPGRTQLNRSAARRSGSQHGTATTLHAGSPPQPRPVRIVIHPAAAAGLGIDVTREVTSAIADILWRHYGGNEVLNWLEAERLLQQSLSALRTIAAAS